MRRLVVTGRPSRFSALLLLVVVLLLFLFLLLFLLLLSGAMPKKRVLLPDVFGATPRGDASVGRVLWDPNAAFDSAQASAQASDLSTTLPSSRESRRLEGEFSADFQQTSDGDDWIVQTPEEIINEVRRSVQARKPWREEIDEEALEEKRKNEKQERVDRGFHIILPDNRVRAMEDQLSRRLRAQLLGEEEDDEAAPEVSTANPQLTAAQRREERARGLRPKARNPWYLPPKIWYSGKVGKDPNQISSGGFPYDAQIMGDAAAPKPPHNEEQETRSYDDGVPRQLTKRDKETLQIVEHYKNYMKGQRLPHFLQ